MLERRDTGMGGYRTRGMQECRVQDWRDAEQERCWKGGIQEWGMQDKRDAGMKSSG